MWGKVIVIIMNKFYLLLLGFIFNFAPVVLGQNALQDITVQQAVEIGLKNSYLIAIAEKNVQIAKNNNTLGEAGGLPVVNIGLGSNSGVSKINNPTSFLNGGNTLTNVTNPNIEANWVVYEGGKVAINKERLGLLEVQQQGQVKIAIENVLLAVNRNYYGALIQKKRLEICAELLKLSRDKIAYIEARTAYGAAGEFDKIQITDAYLNDSVAWVLQYNSYQIALQNLAMAMNVSPDEGLGYNLVENIAFVLPKYDVEQLKSKLLTNNQKISNLKTAELIATNQIKLQKVGRMPKVSLSATASDQFTFAKISGLEPRFPNEWRGGSTISGGLNLVVSYNLYNGGKLKRSIDNAALQAEISTLQRKEEERVQTQTLQLGLYRYENQLKLLDLQKNLLANAAKNLSLAEERYKGNTLNFFDLQTIQANYVRANNGLFDAFLNAKNTEIELLIMVGR